MTISSGSETTAADPASTIPNRPVLLQARGLERRSADRLLLDDVSMEIRGSDRFAIVGPAGSGKTLLLRALALLDPLEGGHVRWYGEEVHREDVPRFRSRVIYLNQRPVLTEGTVEESLKQPFSLHVHRERRFDPDLHRVRLASLDRDESFLGKQQRDLSGGESQIVALLRVMQLDPEVLLLDEPTSALDSHSSQVVERLVAAWLDEQPDRRATVWVTHDHQQAHRVADCVLEMNNGFLQSNRSI